MMKFFTDFRTWIGIFILVIGITAGITGWAELPKKVTAIDAKTQENKDSVQKLASTMDKYIDLQEQRAIDQEKRDIERQTNQERREELMLKLIEQNRGQ